MAVTEVQTLPEARQPTVVIKTAQKASMVRRNLYRLSHWQWDRRQLSARPIRTLWKPERQPETGTEKRSWHVYIFPLLLFCLLAIKFREVLIRMPIRLVWFDIGVRLLCTLVTGFVIGLNRGEHGRPAGLRTTMLVSLAACVAMILSNALLATAGRPEDSFITLDPMRLPLGILAGMGFIGAGAILRRDNLLLAQVRHETARDSPKPFRVSLGDGGVCTTF